MKKFYKTISTLLLILSIIFSFPINANASSNYEEEDVSTREIIHVTSYGSTDSGRVTLRATLSLNTYGDVIGIQNVTTSSWNADVDYITWTSLQISSNKDYAYCAVNYRYNLKFYTETIVFYP